MPSFPLRSTRQPSYCHLSGPQTIKCLLHSLFCLHGNLLDFLLGACISWRNKDMVSYYTVLGAGPWIQTNPEIV